MHRVIKRSPDSEDGAVDGQREHYSIQHPSRLFEMSSENRHEYSLWLRTCAEDDIVKEPLQGVLENGGEIPPWLSGVLYRTGYGLYVHGSDKLNHAFDPLAVVHAIEVKDGKAFYRNRPVEGNCYHRNRDNKRLVISEFGTVFTPDPCLSILGRFMTRFDKPEANDNGGVNAFFNGDELFVSTETHLIRKLDPASLETSSEATDHSEKVAV